jgi:AraC-like DNA-binding protein
MKDFFIRFIQIFLLIFTFLPAYYNIIGNMEDYNKIVESLGVKFIDGKTIEILHPVSIENQYHHENAIILLNKGEIKFGDKDEVVKEGEVLFIPGGNSLSITYGEGHHVRMSNDDFISAKDKYLKDHEGLVELEEQNFCIIICDALVFDTVSFFSSLDIPAFKIKDKEIAHNIRTTIEETVSEEVGYNRIVKVYTEQLVIQSLRYIIGNHLFVEQLATNSTYFKDPRLINIFAYIKKNIGEDLSNKVLANVANVSEDYVGQYFKMLTGINPQDYIEYQRMEAAVDLLRTSKKSIRQIGSDVGYKDTAYFCRRFKMMFGIPAGKMRRRESLMNV